MEPKKQPSPTGCAATVKNAKPMTKPKANTNWCKGAPPAEAAWRNRIGIRWMLRRMSICPNAFYNYWKEKKSERGSERDRKMDVSRACSLKVEVIYCFHFHTDEQLGCAIAECAYLRYNRIHPHSYNNYLTRLKARISLDERGSGVIKMRDQDKCISWQIKDYMLLYQITAVRFSRIYWNNTIEYAWM